MLRRHEPYWNPNAYQPLEHPHPRWEEQIFSAIRSRVTVLLARYSAGEIEWKDFISDRKCSDGDWGMNMCLWYQHHKHDPRHKNLGRPFWSVEAFREWVANIASLAPGDVRDVRGHFTKRTLEKSRDGKLGAFLRHEHVVPKNQMIKWLLSNQENAGTILRKNVSCVITLNEDARLEKDTHPDPTNPWRRYEGAGISVLFNPDWSDDVLAELKRHGLLTDESYEPLGKSSFKYRVSR